MMATTNITIIQFHHHHFAIAKFSTRYHRFWKSSVTFFVFSIAVFLKVFLFFLDSCLAWTCSKFVNILIFLCSFTVPNSSPQCQALLLLLLGTNLIFVHHGSISFVHLNFFCLAIEVFHFPTLANPPPRR